MRKKTKNPLRVENGRKGGLKSGEVMRKRYSAERLREIKSLAGKKGMLLRWSKLKDK